MKSWTRLRLWAAIGLLFELFRRMRRRRFCGRTASGTPPCRRTLGVPPSAKLLVYATPREDA